MTDRIQHLVPMAQVLGFSGASALSAYIASFSFIGIPACQMAPIDLQAKKWSRIYHIGKDSVPPIAVGLSACFGFLAYQTRNLQSSKLPISPVVLYSTAAALLPLIPGYTFTIMWNGVQALEKKAAAESDAPSEGETKKLMEVWSGQNLVRAALAGGAAVLAGAAMFN